MSSGMACRPGLMTTLPAVASQLAADVEPQGAGSRFAQRGQHALQLPEIARADPGQQPIEHGRIRDPIEQPAQLLWVGAARSSEFSSFAVPARSSSGPSRLVGTRWSNASISARDSSAASFSSVAPPAVGPIRLSRSAPSLFFSAVAASGVSSSSRLRATSSPSSSASARPAWLATREAKAARAAPTAARNAMPR